VKLDKEKPSKNILDLRKPKPKKKPKKKQKNY